MTGKDTYYIGTDLKFSLNIYCEDFNMSEDPWTATVIGEKGTIVCDKEHNAAEGEEGQWYILIDTTILGNGVCYIVVEIDVPDADFAEGDNDDGYRHEVYKQKLMTIKNL